MAWANFVEAEMKKMAKIFEKLEPPMAEELVPRLGGEFNPSDPQVYSGWSREEMEAERERKEEVARVFSFSFIIFISRWQEMKSFLRIT